MVETRRLKLSARGTIGGGGAGARGSGAAGEGRRANGSTSLPSATAVGQGKWKGRTCSSGRAGAGVVVLYT